MYKENSFWQLCLRSPIPLLSVNGGDIFFLPELKWNGTVQTSLSEWMAFLYMLLHGEILLPKGLSLWQVLLTLESKGGDGDFPVNAYTWQSHENPVISPFMALKTPSNYSSSHGSTI